jgi:ferredoxin
MAKLIVTGREGEFSEVESLQHFDERRSRLACQILNTDELDGLILSVAPEE